MDITSSPNAYERYQLVNFWKLMEKTEKIQNHVKKNDFWPNLHETSCCHGNAKNDGNAFDTSKFL